MKISLAFCYVFVIAALSPFTTNICSGAGELDSLNLNLPYSGSFAGVYATAVQWDGKILIGGYFDSILGQPRTNIARLNADGSLDTSFNLNSYDVSIVEA